MNQELINLTLRWHTVNTAAKHAKAVYDDLCSQRAEVEAQIKKHEGAKPADKQVEVVIRPRGK